MKQLPESWAPLFLATPETGMGFHTGNLVLKDGRRFADAIFTSGFITKVRGHTAVPFDAEDIVSIEITGNRWDWNE